MEACAAEDIDFLVAGIGGQTNEDGQVVLLLDEEVLGGSKTNVCDAEAIGVVAGGCVGDGSESSLPVDG